MSTTAKGTLSVIILFLLSSVATAERHSDLFYNVLLSPFIITGLPGDPSYAAFFGCALLFLLLVTVMASSTKHRVIQRIGWVLWIAHSAGALWILYWSDWHPFVTRFSLGIVLTFLFTGLYLYWTYLVVSPFWHRVREVSREDALQTKGASSLQE